VEGYVLKKIRKADRRDYTHALPTGIRFSSQTENLRRVIAISLAVMGILFGAFGLHSMGAPHTDSIHPAANATQLPAVQGTITSATVSATVAAAGWTGSPTAQADGNWGSSMGFAILVVVCGILAILVALLALTRTPSLFSRLRDSAHHIIQLIPDARGHAFAPSLALLSISRI